MVALAAPDAGTEKAAGPKETTIELLIRVTGGEPPKPVHNAEISLIGPDGATIGSPKRTSQKGEARFRDLAKGEVTIMVIARDWKTFKAARPIAKPHETADVLLQPLD